MAQQNPSRPVTVCLKFAVPATGRTTVRLNQQPPIRIAADTCLQLAYPRGPVGYLLVEAEGYYPEKIAFRADTLRRPLSVMLLKRIIELGEVTVRSNSAVRYRGDTLVLGVDSVKTQPHASATDLLNNMAGASVDPGGQVKILGKTIGRVTVEGKPLYGNNPKAALEALNADMIKNLELSETPGAGGEGETSLNIRLKDDRKTGAYGRVDGLLGTSRTYATSARVSQLTPGHFLNAFVTANNVYEQALSSDDQNTLVRNAITKEAQGSYSVTETALPRPTSMQADRNVQNLVEPALNVGRVNTVNGGANYNRSTEKADLFGYALAEHTTQELQRTFRTDRYLDPFRQRDAGVSADTYSRTKASAYFNGKWTLDHQQTLAISGSLGLRRVDSGLNSDLATVLTRDTATLSRSNLTQQSASTERHLYASQQAVWVKRYARPAEISSFSFRYAFASHGLSQEYRNQLSRGTNQQVFNNRIERLAQEYSYEGQAVHALPLSRKLLLEGKVTWAHETFPISQQGYQIRGGQEQYAPGLSSQPFQITDQQQTARLALYYKTPRFSALFSPTVWWWSSLRQVDAAQLIRRQRTAFLPAFFAEYRPDAVTRFSLRYGQAQVLPAPERLFPVPDSSNIQFIRVGNPQLVQTLRQNLEATATSALGNNKFTLSARYGVDDGPVSLDTRPNSLGFLTQTYRQPDLQLPSLSTSLLWYQFNQLKSYSFHAFTTAQWLESYLFTQGSPVRLQTFVGLVAAGVKWNAPHNTVVKLDWRTTFTQQRSAADGPSSARNSRHEPVLRLEKKWPHAWYTEVSSTALLNSYAQGKTSANVFVDLTVSKFLFQEERVKLAISGRNLLNNATYQTNTFGGNTQRQETVERLPRFLLVGLSVYPERWR